MRRTCSFHPIRSLWLLVVSLIVFTANLSMANAQEPGWTTRVLKVGEDRRQTNAQPIIERPYRPLHFFGNTVRRQYYRGSVLPTPKDLSQTVRMLTRG